MLSCPQPSSLFVPLLPLLQQIPFEPSAHGLALLCRQQEVRTESGAPVSFVAPQPDGMGYEERVWARGEVETRPDNWHDFFNALVWLAFPRSKAALNARHRRASLAAGEGRGRERDAMTHFDECGVIVVSSDPELLGLVRDFRWKALFHENRSALGERLRCFIFGHATYEQLLSPFRGLTAKAVLYEVDETWLERPLAGQLSSLDGRLAEELAAGAHAEPRQLHPLPLMGWPGVTAESAEESYFDDTWQFRPGRRRASV